MRVLTFAVCALVALVAAPGIVHAGKSKVVVLQIDGDDGNAVEKALASALSEDFTVSPLKDTNKAIKAMGGLDEEPSDKDFAKLAESLSADVVVASKLDGKSDGKQLHIRLYVKGKKSKKFSVQFGNPASDKFKKTMQKTLVDKIGAINKAGDEEDADDAPKKKKAKKSEKDDDAADDDAVKPMKKVAAKKKGDAKAEKAEKAEKADKKTEKADDADADDAPVKKAKKVAKKSSDDDTAAADDEDAKPVVKKKKSKKADDDEAAPTESEEGPSFGKPHAPNRDAVRVDFGVGVANRSLAFTSRQFTDGQGPPHPYANAPVPAGHLTAEIFPLAFQNPKSPAAGLGLWGDYDKTISLTLRSTQPATDTTISAKATQQRWSIGGGYRFAFTRSDLSPTVTVGINYGRQSFIIDRSMQAAGATIDLPDTSYKMWQPLLAFRVPFSSAVALVAQGRGMLITDAGSITTSAEYGQASVFGFQAEAGLDVTFASRFAIRAMGYFGQVGYTFTKGVGEKANDRDGDPSTKDIFGALDRSVGGSLTLGVLY